MQNLKHLASLINSVLKFACSDFRVTNVTLCTLYVHFHDMNTYEGKQKMDKAS